MEADWEEFPPRLEVPDEWIDSHLPPALAGLSGYVAVAPGAEYGPAKQWPAVHFRATARSLAEMGRTVVTVAVVLSMAVPGSTNKPTKRRKW